MAERETHWSVCLYILACLTYCVRSQSTNGLGKAGCSFLDDQNVFNIELAKGTHQAPCPSLNSLNDDFKQTEDKISETAYELSRIQTRIVDLLDVNNQLTRRIHNVQDELRATLYALKSGDVGTCGSERISLRFFSFPRVLKLPLYFCKFGSGTSVPVIPPVQSQMPSNSLVDAVAAVGIRQCTEIHVSSASTNIRKQPFFNG